MVRSLVRSLGELLNGAGSQHLLKPGRALCQMEQRLVRPSTTRSQLRCRYKRLPRRSGAGHHAIVSPNARSRARLDDTPRPRPRRSWRPSLTSAAQLVSTRRSPQPASWASENAQRRLQFSIGHAGNVPVVLVLHRLRRPAHRAIQHVARCLVGGAGEGVALVHQVRQRVNGGGLQTCDPFLSLLTHARRAAAVDDADGAAGNRATLAALTGLLEVAAQGT